MAKLDLKSLISKLNTTCHKSLESAAGLCLTHTHYEVELEHFLVKLLDMSDTDLQKILRHFEINEAHLVGDLTRALEEFKTGNARTPALSPSIPRMVKPGNHSPGADRRGNGSSGVWYAAHEFSRKNHRPYCRRVSGSRKGNGSRNVV